MGLYRNVAGVSDGRSVGLSSIFREPIQTVEVIDISYLPDIFGDPAIRQQQQAEIQAAYDKEMYGRYDWLMSQTYATLTAAGFYVTQYPVAIFQNDQSYLSLDYIQKIENERGTAGALILHMQEPAIAKDTAGYEGGTSGSWLQDQGVEDPTVYQETEPIPQIETLPPVISSEDGSVTFEVPNFPTPTTTQTATPTTTTPTTSTPLPTDRNTAIRNNMVPLAVLAGLVVVAIAGDELLHERRKLVFLGGMGALFYLMAKKQ